jgi:hypothetical protein
VESRCHSSGVLCSSVGRTSRRDGELADISIPPQLARKGSITSGLRYIDRVREARPYLGKDIEVTGRYQSYPSPAISAPLASSTAHPCQPSSSGDLISLPPTHLEIKHNVPGSNQQVLPRDPHFTMPRGKLIVLEGLDRAGKSTQCQLLVSSLQEAGLKVRHMRFPGKSCA